MECSLARALAQVGDSWTLLIMKEIMLGNRRFDGIHKQPGMSSPFSFFAYVGAGSGADYTAFALLALAASLRVSGDGKRKELVAIVSCTNAMGRPMDG
jgi:hypothetical protein